MGLTNDIHPTQSSRQLAYLTDYLRSFNRKERFWLLGEVIGNHDLFLSSKFAATVSASFGVAVPGNAFVGMDYHIDWIAASLQMLAEGSSKLVFRRDKEKISGQQEDVDLLVAFETERALHMIFLEAKGVEAFDNKQLISKLHRLKRIFGDLRSAHVVEPHFGIVSPFKPKRIDTRSFPKWALSNDEPIWIALNNIANALASGRLYSITRCDSDGKANPSGAFWKRTKERAHTK